MDSVPGLRAYIPQLREVLHCCALRLVSGAGSSLFRPGELARRGDQDGAGEGVQKTHARYGESGSEDRILTTQDRAVQGQDVLTEVADTSHVK